VLRPRLAQQFSASLERLLTLVCAPAGYGKTTLIAEWLSSDAGEGFRAAWFSLDDDDNDPSRFLSYLVSAFAQISDVNLNELLSLMRSPQPPPPKILLTALLSQIEAVPDPIILVLDDYHVITAAPIHEAMTFLLDHLPARIHLVITSREDPSFPLARLRGRGLLAEIRADELRFTPDEAGQFLAQMLGISLSAEQIRDLDARTEGWIAGLQLAALAMKGRGDVDSFISAFTGSHRFILDYLTEEVLNRQPESVKQFLLHTSVLNRLCGPLCDAVTGGTDGQDMLEHIERGNLFMISLDDERCWYRYHYLFAEMLRKRSQQTITESAILEQRRRASRWFAEESLIDEAVSHAIVAKDFEFAASTLEGAENISFAEWRVGAGLRWSRLLPEAVIARHPRLLLHLGLWYARTGQNDIAQKHLRDARAALELDAFAPDTQTELSAYANLIEANFAILRGEASRALALVESTLAALLDDNLRYRHFALTIAGVAHRMLGNFDSAERAYSENYDIAAKLRDGELLIRTVVQAATTKWLFRVSLSDSIALYSDTLALLIEWNQHYLPTIGVIYVSLGAAQFELNQLDDAVASSLLALKHSENTVPNVAYAAYLVLIRAYQCLGAVDEMLTTARKLNELHKMFPSMPGALLYLYQLHIWIIGHALDGVVDLNAYTKEAMNATAAIKPTPYMVQLFTIRNRMRHDLATLPDTLMQLEGLQAEFETKAMNTCLIDVLIVKALVLDKLKRMEEAGAAITQALKLTEPHGLVRTFVDEGTPMAALLREARARGIAVDYVTNLLSAFDHETPAKSTARYEKRINGEFEPLSERELEVLQLIADGASNREIAHQLVVSLGTVKKHLNNIFLKLDAHSRTQALAAAKKYKLL